MEAFFFRGREAVEGAPIARSEERAFFERPTGAPPKAG
jgi:hypothetical protein